MRIPITRDGYGVLAVTTLLLVVLGFLWSAWTPWCWVPIAAVWIWAIAFFRDPAREVPRDPAALYAPADGRITEVVELPGHEHVPGPCWRIRIFLSIFNTHINRSPCAASVKSVKFTPGRFLNALNPRSAETNEANLLLLDPAAPFAGPIVVRQIAGLIARTIVCHAAAGDRLASGERIGMIRFGSGTELIVPVQPGLQVTARTGEQVRAGLTVLARVAE